MLMYIRSCVVSGLRVADARICSRTTLRGWSVGRPIRVRKLVNELSPYLKDLRHNITGEERPTRAELADTAPTAAPATHDASLAATGPYCGPDTLELPADTLIDDDTQSAGPAATLLDPSTMPFPEKQELPADPVLEDDYMFQSGGLADT